MEKFVHFLETIVVDFAWVTNVLRICVVLSPRTTNDTNWRKKKQSIFVVYEWGSEHNMLFVQQPDILVFFFFVLLVAAEYCFGLVNLICAIWLKNWYVSLIQDCVWGVLRVLCWNFPWDFDLKPEVRAGFGVQLLCL